MAEIGRFFWAIHLSSAFIVSHSTLCSTSASAITESRAVLCQEDPGMATGCLARASGRLQASSWPSEPISEQCFLLCDILCLDSNDRAFGVCIPFPGSAAVIQVEEERRTAHGGSSHGRRIDLTLVLVSNI
jgi:hypothetical protein